MAAYLAVLVTCLVAVDSVDCGTMNRVKKCSEFQEAACKASCVQSGGVGALASYAPCGWQQGTCGSARGASCDAGTCKHLAAPAYAKGIHRRMSVFEAKNKVQRVFDTAAEGDRVLVVYRNQEVPHDQGYDVWSLANQNAGEPSGTLTYMDGSFRNKHGVTPFIDSKGYPKIVAKYYVAVTGKFGHYAACNGGKCCPVPTKTAPCNTATQRALTLGRRQDGAISFPHVPDDNGNPMAMCGDLEALRTHGCTWKQLGVAKVVTAKCLYRVVRGKNENGGLSFAKSVSKDAVKRFESAFDRDEKDGGCPDLLSNGQKLPHPSVSGPQLTELSAWRGIRTFAEDASKRTGFELALAQTLKPKLPRKTGRKGGRSQAVL
jgi:hypothetical protein